tara:strand:+ start:1249 stop:2358 length:1110 start_codon:yes stop_codon:yes gene_type:complete
MIVELDIESLINFLSIAIGFFLAIHFLTLRGINKNSNLFLGLFLLQVSISVFITQVEFLIVESNNIRWLFLPIISPFAYMPILYYHSLSITNLFKANGKKMLWIFIPALIELCLKLVLFLFYPNLTLGDDFFNSYIYITLYLSTIYSLFILYLLLKIIKIHNANILNLFSTIEDKQLNWLRLLSIVNIGFNVIWFLDDSLVLLGVGNPVSHFIAEFSLFGTLINICWMGFASLRQPSIFKLDIDKYTSDKKSNSTIEDELLFSQFKLQIESDFIYLKSDLTLKELANELNTRDKELSRIINLCYSQNFFHFINSYRINYFKKHVNNPDKKNLSIEGLAFEAGFKSKSSFYTAFKKIEKMTPKEFELSIK